MLGKLAVSLALAAALCCHGALAAEGDPCSRFTWDVAHELAVMQQSPQPVTAATAPGSELETLQIDRLYEIKLSAQSGVHFAAAPGKPTLPDSTQAGLVRFHTGKAGAYRVAITSGHWIDIVDSAKLVPSRDFQGARGCERPHKIVAYELLGDHDYVLQLSGGADSTVVLAITAR